MSAPSPVQPAPDLERLHTLEQSLQETEALRRHRIYQERYDALQDLKRSGTASREDLDRLSASVQRAFSAWKEAAEQQPVPPKNTAELEASLAPLDALLATRASASAMTSRQEAASASFTPQTIVSALRSTGDGRTRAQEALRQQPALRKKVADQLSTQIERFSDYPKTRAELIRLREEVNRVDATERSNTQEETPSPVSAILAGLADPRLFTATLVQTLLTDRALQEETRATLARRAQYFTAPANKTLVASQQARFDALETLPATVLRKQEIRLEELLAKVGPGNDTLPSVIRLKKEIDALRSLAGIAETSESLDLGDGLEIKPETKTRPETPVAKKQETEPPATPREPSAEELTHLKRREDLRREVVRLEQQRGKIEEQLSRYGDDVFDLVNGLATPRIPLRERLRNALRAASGKGPESNTWEALHHAWSVTNDALDQTRLELANWHPYSPAEPTPETPRRKQPARSRRLEAGPKTSLPTRELSLQEAGMFEGIQQSYASLKSWYEEKYHAHTLTTEDIDRAIMQAQNLHSQLLVLLGSASPFPEQVAALSAKLHDVLLDLTENRRYQSRWEKVRAVQSTLRDIKDRLSEAKGAERLALGQRIAAQKRILESIPDDVDASQDEDYVLALQEARQLLHKTAQALRDTR